MKKKGENEEKKLLYFHLLCWENSLKLRQLLKEICFILALKYAGFFLVN